MSYEIVRLLYTKFGLLYARRLKRRHKGFGDILAVDQLLCKSVAYSYLWQAVDQDSEVVDVDAQQNLDGAADKCFFHAFSAESEERTECNSRLESDVV